LAFVDAGWFAVEWFAVGCGFRFAQGVCGSGQAFGEVVAGLMVNGGDEEMVVVVTGEVVGVVGQMKGRAGGEAADAAFAFKLFQAGVDGLPLVGEQTLALGVVRLGVGAGVMPGGNDGGMAVVVGKNLGVLKPKVHSNLRSLLADGVSGEDWFDSIRVLGV
jgi:hypothetical protein